MSPGKLLTLNQVLVKAAAYCAYQERCHMEVEQKLAEWGVYGQEAAAVIAQLIEQNYLNEERFALAFARGKFRQKHWGRIKIRLELKAKHISPYCIDKALNSVDEEEYRQTMNELIQKKQNELGTTIHSKAKIIKYMMQKGYEQSLISELLKER